MCDFCSDIADNDKKLLNKRIKFGEFIYKIGDEYGILVDTGDSFCVGTLANILFCPMCGRNLKGECGNE